MQVTEAEAKEKWCPFARVESHNYPETAMSAVNRFSDAETCLGNCVGSKCMAWRWASTPIPQRYGTTLPNGSPEPKRPDRVPPDWVWKNAGLYSRLCFWEEPAEATSARRRGWCGLSGKPGRDQKEEWE